MAVSEVRCSKAAENWENALICGNGALGAMVMGQPHNETITVNHEKLWVPALDGKREAVEMKHAWATAREMIKEGKFGEARIYSRGFYAGAVTHQWPGSEFGHSSALPKDRTHAAMHLLLDLPEHGTVRDYSRSMRLNSGEIVVRWSDDSGQWERRVFASRPDNVLAILTKQLDGEPFDCHIMGQEAPGAKPGDIRSVSIQHADDEIYLHAAYARTLGKPEPAGFHSLCRVTSNGTLSADDRRITATDATEVLVLLCLDTLASAVQADRAPLRSRLHAIEADYAPLIERHAATHSRMFGRVSLDLHGNQRGVAKAESILASADKDGSTPALLETMHALGRYTLISSSGKLPPALMGIWGNDWEPAWGGRFTTDSNLNLAVAGGNQGNMHEAMESYFGFIEDIARDWEHNAQNLYGCRGYVSELTQGPKDGINTWGYYPWTGGAGWLGSYFYDHYLYTLDQEFLRERVIPYLKHTVLFYEDFLRDMEGEDGRVVFYPSVSPENSPAHAPDGSQEGALPNSTSEIAICKQAITNLITACRELDVETESIPRWEGLLAKLPDYRINEDGAIAEWSWPGVIDFYNHRHTSHLYSLYPARELREERTPELCKAARIAMTKRLEQPRLIRSCHGLMHMMFFAIRLRDSELLWHLFGDFARQRYLYESLITSHNPDHEFFNLDAILSWPGVLMEMLVYTEPGVLELLPALPAEHLPTGKAEGILAHGKITIESLQWDMPSGTIDVNLRSGIAQTICLIAPQEFTTMELHGEQRTFESKTAGRPTWDIAIPEGDALCLQIRQTG